MQILIENTTAYKIFRSDRAGGRLSHAYMLHFADSVCLRDALKMFAAEFFGGTPEVLPRVKNGTYPDFMLYPEEGKKITADGVNEIIADSALRPVEGAKKLYVIDGFDGASALVQNKLLKTLEEPPEGIYFLLGAVSLAPVLETVLSRVKLLEIPPFAASEILDALNRKSSDPLNRAAAESCNGVFGDALNMVGGGWFAEVREGAEKICFATEADKISALAKQYGDTKYKTELLSEMRNIYFSALKGEGKLNTVLQKHTLIYALEQLTRANADVKYNAYFQGLLFDFMLKVSRENDRWLKLQE